MKNRILVAGLCLLMASNPLSYGNMIIPEQFSVPARFGDMLLFSQRTGSELYAIDSRSQRDVWVWASGHRCVRTRPTITNGVAYIWAGNMTNDCRACAVDCRTGKSMRETPDGGWTSESAIVVGETVLFPVEAYIDEIHSFDCKTGSPRWTLKGYKLILVHGQVILATTDKDTQAVLLDAVTGKEIFKTRLDEQKYENSHADCSEGGLAILATRNNLLALSIPSRQVLWNEHGGRKERLPAIAQNTLYLLSGYPPFESMSWSSQTLEVRDLSDGRIDRRVSLRTGPSTYFPALVFKDVIVVTSNYGVLLLGLERESLKESWRLQVERVYEIEKDSDSVFVGTEGPYLWQVEANTGKVLLKYTRKRAKGTPPGRSGTGSTSPLGGADR